MAAKRLSRETATPNRETALRRETLTIRARAASAADGREGFAVFLEKREPVFPGQ